MRVPDYAEALALAVEVASRARGLLLEECARANGPRGSGGDCPADQEVVWEIRRALLEGFPTWGFLGEETGLQWPGPGERHVWVVDPNDGTSWMQRGFRGHAVSIAVVREGAPVLGDTDTNAAICGALLGAVYGRSGVPSQWQRMILSCRPAPGLSGVKAARPAMFWPTDALVLAERLLG